MTAWMAGPSQDMPGHDGADGYVGEACPGETVTRCRRGTVGIRPSPRWRNDEYKVHALDKDHNLRDCTYTGIALPVAYLDIRRPLRRHRLRPRGSIGSVVRDICGS